MSAKLENMLNQLKVLILCGLAVLATQAVNLKGELDILPATLGMLIIIAVSIAALKIKEALPLQIPAFAWASLLSLLLTTPWSPVQGLILDLTKQISAGQIGTVILAIAGVSIGCKLDDIKKLSWKIVIVSFVVMASTYFGSAAISNIILSLKGMI